MDLIPLCQDRSKVRDRSVCRTVYVYMSVHPCWCLENLGSMSLHPQAKRDCQGPLCKGLEHSKHSVRLCCG